MQAMGDALVRCAIYTRIHRRAGQGGLFPGGKRRAVAGLCPGSGWAIYKLYIDDGYSAASRNRPALKKLLFDASMIRFAGLQDRPLRGAAHQSATRWPGLGRPGPPQTNKRSYSQRRGKDRAYREKST